MRCCQDRIKLMTAQSTEPGAGRERDRPSGLHAPADVRAARLVICKGCPRRVTAFGGRWWCGRPWIVDPAATVRAVRRIVANAFGVSFAVPETEAEAVGCGCELRLKTAYAGASCPEGRW